MMNNAKLTTSRKDLFDRKPFRIFIFIVVPAMIFVLVCAGILVSRFGIDHTIVVFGQKQVMVNRPTAIRVALISDKGGFFQPDKLQGVIKKNNASYPVFNKPTSDKGRVVTVNFNVPQMELGPAILELQIGFGEKRRTVQTHIEVVGVIPSDSSIIPSDVSTKTGTTTVKKNDYTVQVFTEDRAAPTGISSLLFIRTLAKANQLAQTKLLIGLPGKSVKSGFTQKEYKTDPLGLLALPVKPVDLDYPLEINGVAAMGSLFPMDSEPNSLVPADNLSTNQLDENSRLVKAKSDLKADAPNASVVKQALKNSTGIPADLVAVAQDASAVPQKKESSNVPSSSKTEIKKTGTPKPAAQYLFPKVVYSGISVVSQNPIVESGQAVRFRVSQISLGGPLYVDIFQDGRIVQSISTWVDGKGFADLVIKPKGAGLLKVQFFNSAIASDTAIAVRHIYVLEASETINDGLIALSSLVEKQTALIQSVDESPWFDEIRTIVKVNGASFNKTQLAAYLLGRLYNGHVRLERIVSSRNTDDTELAAFKEKFQRSIMMIIVLLGIAIAAFITMTAAQSYKRQARISKLIMEDLDEDSLGDPHQNSVWRFGGQVLLLILIIIGAFASIAVLVDTMTWHQ